MTNDPKFGLSEEEIDRLKRGDTGLQSKIFDKHALSFVKLAMKTWRVSMEEAEEAVSTAFSKFFCQIEKEDFESKNYPGYVYTILKNACYKITEKQKNNLEKPTDVLPVVATQENDDYLMDMLNFGFNRLCDKCQKVLTWFYWDKKKHKEIAVDLGIKEDASKQRLKECRDKLRAICLEKMTMNKA